MRGLSTFHTESNNFNRTGARMLDCIYHRTVNVLGNHIFVCITQDYVI